MNKKFILSLSLLFLGFSITMAQTITRKTLNIAPKVRLDTIKEFDRKGNLTSIQYSKGDGSGFVNQIIHFEYDRKNRLVKEYETDTLGEIFRKEKGASITTYKYKKKRGKKIVITRFFDYDMKLAYFSEAGFHTCTTTYDKNDVKLEDWCFNKAGYTQSRTQYIYNDKEQLEEVHYLKEDGTFQDVGYAKVVLEYDEMDREIKRSRYDANENPYIGIGEAFLIETDYNEENSCKRFYNHKMELMSNHILKNPYPAPELSFLGPDRKTTYSLSDLKGKVVILDFWASWCRPCRAKGNPNLVALYKKYNDHGLEIFSVSLDGDLSGGKEKEEIAYQRWLDAIEDDNLIWEYHISDLTKWQSEPAKIYNVEFIPKLFIINRDGNIVAVNPLGFCKIEETILEYL